MYSVLVFLSDMLVLASLVITGFLLVPIDQQFSWVRENPRRITRLVVFSLLLVLIGVAIHVAIEYMFPRLVVEQLTVNYNGVNHTLGEELYATINGERIPLQLRVEYGYAPTMFLGMLGAFLGVVELYLLLDEKCRARGEVG
jgi:hypothetical protein